VLAHPWFGKETKTLAQIKVDFDNRKAIVD
jgi:hypothetical protein